MKLSTKGRYGLNAMYHMAISNDSLITLKDLSDSTGVPQPYLEKLLGLLKKGDLISSVRGVQGGYRLARQPKDISVGEILRALENGLAFTDCENAKKCGNYNCPSQSMFKMIYDRLNVVLNQLTLQDIINQNKGENL